MTGGRIRTNVIRCAEAIYSTRSLEEVPRMNEVYASNSSGSKLGNRFGVTRLGRDLPESLRSNTTKSPGRQDSCAKISKYSDNATCHVSELHL